MIVGSLFSGIGGLDLGLRWAGFELGWLTEIEVFRRSVLAKNWPGVPIYNDVKEITTDNAIPVDVIAGGFPCQDISWAGRGRGIDYDLPKQEGTGSGLWWEMWRVIRDFRPRYVIAENVPALTHRGLDTVLGSLAEIGYDAEWQTISAAAVGAPHVRERLFIVAYPNIQQVEYVPDERCPQGGKEAPPAGQVDTCEHHGGAIWPKWDGSFTGVLCEPDGVPDRVGQISGFGDSVVPQVGYLVGRAIMDREFRYQRNNSVIYQHFSSRGG